MLSLKEIQAFYPEPLKVYRRFIIREYLQYKILEIIFESRWEKKLAFMGGTCLRIVHGNNRFSKDLDFDNFDLTRADFDALTNIIRMKLDMLGYEAEIRHTIKGAYHCYIRIPGLLYNEGIAGSREEKILIRLGTEPQQFNYKPEQPVLNKFDVFSQINVTPGSLLLSQKFYSVINRRRNKGRDFFDIVFLLGLGQTPDYEYLNAKTGIQTPEELRERIIDKCAGLDMQEMAADVKPYLFYTDDVKKVLLFPAYIKQAGLHPPG